MMKFTPLFFFTGNTLIILKVSNTNLHNLHINPSIFHLINSGFQKKYFIFMPSYKAKMVVMWKKKMYITNSLYLFL